MNIALWVVFLQQVQKLITTQSLLELISWVFPWVQRKRRKLQEKTDNITIMGVSFPWVQRKRHKLQEKNRKHYYHGNIFSLICLLSTVGLTNMFLEISKISITIMDELRTLTKGSFKANYLVWEDPRYHYGSIFALAYMVHI